MKFQFTRPIFCSVRYASVHNFFFKAKNYIETPFHTSNPLIGNVSSPDCKIQPPYFPTYRKKS